MSRRKKKDRSGHKQHLFEEGEVTDEFLLAHRELEFLRAGARAKKNPRAHRLHMQERSEKLQEIREKVAHAS